MSIFQRIFRVGKAEAHAAIDKLEDPIKMTEQGIRDLKKDLNTAMTSLAEVKGQAIRLRKQAADSKKAAADYERKAMALLQKVQSGDLDAAEVDRLATEALNRKEENVQRAATLNQDAKQQETTAAQLQAQVEKLKSAVAGYENEMRGFLRSNPGLNSRFSRQLLFRDYSADELVEIFQAMAAKAHYELSPDAEATLVQVVSNIWTHRAENFANAREVRNLFERAISAQANRLARVGSSGGSELLLLTLDDLEAAR